jgi:hypothetical protein
MNYKNLFIILNMRRTIFFKMSLFILFIILIYIQKIKLNIILIFSIKNTNNIGPKLFIKSFSICKKNSYKMDYVDMIKTID